MSPEISEEVVESVNSSLKPQAVAKGWNLSMQPHSPQSSSTPDIPKVLVIATAIGDEAQKVRDHLAIDEDLYLAIERFVVALPDIAGN